MIASPFDKGRWERIFLDCLLTDSKGASVLFLVIAMLLMVTMGYVFSYLIPMKQKSAIFPIHSSQAFFIAQSGVEYAIRYAADQGWTTPASLLGLNALGVNRRNLGKGTFTINYDSANNTLSSVGEIPNAGKRKIIVSSFTNFLAKGLILDAGSPPPCWTTLNKTVRFYVKNVSSSNITLNAFFATWTQTGSTRLRNIFMDGTQRYSGNYLNGDPIENFNGGNQTITPSQVMQIGIDWQQARVTGDIIITFYDLPGERYIFNLGSGLPNC